MLNTTIFEAVNSGRIAFGKFVPIVRSVLTNNNLEHEWLSVAVCAFITHLMKHVKK